MSEPSQLVVQVRIGPEDYDRFRRAPPPPANLALDWTGWLEGRTYYGPRITTAEIENSLCRYREGSVDAYLRALIANDSSERGVDRYDAAAGLWTYVVLDASENLGDYIKTLNVLQQIAAAPAVSGYALVFDHFYEDSAVVALLKIAPGASRLLDRLDDDDRAFVEAAKKIVDDSVADV